MIDLRDQSEAQTDSPARFNVLVTEDMPRPEEYWTRQLQKLLEPMGVATHRVTTGTEALDLVDRMAIHAAVVDMGTPMSAVEADKPAGAQPAAVWLRQLGRLLANRPIVVVHGRVYSRRKADRALRDALSFGAFSVLHKPVEMEQLLRVFRRMMDRRYHGGWPQELGDSDSSTC